MTATSALYIYGLHSCGLYSYGLYSHGLAKIFRTVWHMPDKCFGARLHTHAAAHGHTHAYPAAVDFFSLATIVYGLCSSDSRRCLSYYPCLKITFFKPQSAGDLETFSNTQELSGSQRQLPCFAAFVVFTNTLSCCFLNWRCPDLSGQLFAEEESITAFVAVCRCRKCYDDIVH